MGGTFGRMSFQLQFLEISFSTYNHTRFFFWVFLSEGLFLIGKVVRILYL